MVSSFIHRGSLEGLWGKKWKKKSKLKDKWKQNTYISKKYLKYYYITFNLFSLESIVVFA
jgi:hypothetical protein